MATDVAARGIDLPGVSLVVHVEIPRDAAALQHRSGRTGRAGKKGTAVIVVPYQRRKRVETMLRGARIEAEWIEVPTAMMIRQQDRERLLADLLQPIEFEDEDRELATRLLAERSPEDIAAALVHAHRARMPQPEELVANTPEARKAAAAERHRPGFEDVVWFRLNIGRSNGADPKWILPVLCRRGHVSKNEVGAIRISGDETFVQIPRAVAEKFADAARRTGEVEREAGEESLLIEPSATGPREMARSNRKAGRLAGGNQAGGDAPAKVRAKPHRKGGSSRSPGPKPRSQGPGAGGKAGPARPSGKFAGKRPGPRKPRD